MGFSEFAQLREKTGLSVEELANMLDTSPRTLYRWDKGETAPRKPVMDFLNKYISGQGSGNSSDMFTFIDLFAGIGGMRLGFESAGGKCVFTSEWNKYSRQTYQANFMSDHEIDGDITKIPVDDIPAHDVLLAGFPCQPFSIAGVSKKNSLGVKHGFHCKTQGTLFFDVARIIEKHRPKAFLLENVKNLVSHDKGQTFSIILDTLERELGYHVSYRVIDAKGYVPQHRERIFIVGFKEDNGFDLKEEEFKAPLEGPRLSSILHGYSGREKAEEPYTVGKNGKVNEKYTLTPRLWEYLQNYAAKHKAKGNGFGFGLFDGDGVARTLSARYYKDGSEVLIKQKSDRPRRLTPRECARLMGFDNDERDLFKIPVSDTQAYRQFGNAVCVPLIEDIAHKMAPFILDSSLEREYEHQLSQLKFSLRQKRELVPA